MNVSEVFSFSVFSLSSSPRSLLQPHPQLSLLLRHLELEPLDAVLERLLPLANRPGPQAGPAVECLPARRLFLFGGSSRGGGIVVITLAGAPAQPAGVEVAPRLERLDAARLALDLPVGAVEEVRHEGADLVAEGGFGGGEGRLGDEFVVLYFFSFLYGQRFCVCE